MTKKIKCIIVEDEPIAAEVLEDYVAQVPHLQLVATCRDAMYALEVLKRESIDLIFLDIHLPKLKGVDFVKTLKHKPNIIFTTAYHEYAIEGFELEALDYLLKPIAFPRFLQAVNRVPVDNTTAAKAINIQKPHQSEAQTYLFFNVNKKQVKVLLNEITYIESLKDYVRLHLTNRQLVIKYQLGEMVELLPADRFVRVHRSYIVALEKITAFTKEMIELGEFRVPIGRSYKEVLKGRF